eukprot:sb/3468859/
MNCLAAPGPVLTVRSNRIDNAAVWRRHTPFDSQIVRSDRVGGARQMIRGYSVWICQSIGLTHFSLLSKRENCSQSIGLTGLDSKMILCTSAATPSESNGGAGRTKHSLARQAWSLPELFFVHRASKNNKELLHYVIIMRCFPATNGFKIDELASKLDFLMNFVLKKQFFAVAMLVTKCSVSETQSFISFKQEIVCRVRPCFPAPLFEQNKKYHEKATPFPLLMFCMAVPYPIWFSNRVGGARQLMF